MNDDKLINLNTKTHFVKNTIFYLLIDNNFKLIGPNQQSELILLKRNLDNLLIKGMIISSGSYFMFNKFILNRGFIKINGKIKILKNVIDLAFLIILSTGVAKAHNHYIIDNIYNKNLKSLENKYRYLIKNSISSGDDPYKTNQVKIHKYNYSQVYFVFLLVLRLFI
jgi:hypothetical protein